MEFTRKKADRRIMSVMDVSRINQARAATKIRKHLTARLLERCERRT
jgi:hypothetical protein